MGGGEIGVCWGPVGGDGVGDSRRLRLKIGCLRGGRNGRVGQHVDRLGLRGGRHRRTRCGCVFGGLSRDVLGGY